MESARRWSGYVCPDCRFVFRVPRDHDGTGLVCPSCRRMLRVPTANDTPPPLMAPLRQDLSEEPVPTGVRRIKKRRRGKKAGGDHSWEHQPSSSSSSRSRRGEKRQMGLMLIGGATLLALILAGVAVSMRGGPEAMAENSSSANDVAAVVEAPVDTAAPLLITRGDEAFLAEAEPLARQFLEATSVEEILPLVRGPAESEPRIRGFYPDGKIEPSGLAFFNLNRQISILGKAATVMVRTGDYEDRLLAFVETPEGLKIDWESWVGWSEIPWQEFASSKPSTGHLFRVTLSPVEYYNFAFEDESKWQSYRLESPDRQHAIYGYAPRGSVLNQQVRPPGDSKRVALTLMLKFPAGAGSGTQVEIESLLAEGWVEGVEAP